MKELVKFLMSRLTMIALGILVAFGGLINPRRTLTALIKISAEQNGALNKFAEKNNE